MKKKIIKVGICAAYDWSLLRISLPLIYQYADSICISLDRNRRSWSGQQYGFNGGDFQQFISMIDSEKKIDVYEDDFCLPGLSSIENDNRQRTCMALRLGKGGWHIQIDCDEYFYRFCEFVQYLKRIISNPTGEEKPINIMCNWISVFKNIGSGFLIVDNSETNWETMPFATNRPEYLNARRNSHFNHLAPFFVVHDTWARNEDQLRQKLDSWGHNNDFADKEGYIEFWKSMDENGYSQAKDFHPLQPAVWHRLLFVGANGILDLIQKLNGYPLFKVRKWSLFWQNSRNLHRAKKIWEAIISLS